jgi:hypothetical protein
MLFRNNQVDFSIFAFAQKQKEKLGILTKKPTCRRKNTPRGPVIFLAFQRRSRLFAFFRRMASFSSGARLQVSKKLRISAGLAQGRSEPNKIRFAPWAATNALPMAEFIPARSQHMAVSK